jgi:hypothetical protein
MLAMGTLLLRLGQYNGRGWDGRLAVWGFYVVVREYNHVASNQITDVPLRDHAYEKHELNILSLTLDTIVNRLALQHPYVPSSHNLHL